MAGRPTGGEDQIEREVQQEGEDEAEQAGAPDSGVVDQFLQTVTEAEGRPRMEGRTMHLIIGPVKKKKEATKPAAEGAGKGEAASAPPQPQSDAEVPADAAAQ